MGREPWASRSLHRVKRHERLRFLVGEQLVRRRRARGDDDDDVMDNYHILERIGEGSFGKVYRGRRKFTGQIVALKFVSKRGKTPKDLHNLRQEINILRRLNHCNIIAIMDSFETEGEFCMVTEYGQGELFQVLADDQHLPESEIRHITIQLLQALQVLHQKRIIHRDMKPQNILIGSKQQIKLCDFGFARAISAESSVLTSIKGTPLYMAPELVQEKPYNCTVDLWSLGVILYELAVGTPPFYTDKIVTLVQMIVREPVRFPDSMSPIFRSFLSGLLTKDPKRRLSWPDILHHPFVVETPEELKKRLKLEQEFRQLPRFFTTEDHVPVEANQQLKPSVERLRNSGEWKICDPQTGRQVDEEAVVLVGPPSDSKQQEAPQALVTHAAATKTTPVEPSETQAFLKVHEELMKEVKGKRGIAVLEAPLWSQLWDDFLAIHSSDMSDECLNAASGDMVLLYKALGATMKTLDRIESIAPVFETRAGVYHFLEAFVEHDMASDGATADLLYQTVRTCTMLTNIINATESPLPDGVSYRELCNSDVRLITSVLKLKGDKLSGGISRTLKWLGSMLDRSRNLTDLLEEVHSSGMIEALCQVLASSSGQRSPGGTSTKAARDVGLYAVFALATFVHPDGSKWGPLHPFPAMTLRNVAPPNDDPATDVRHLYKLRVKIHGEVTTQLLRSGLQELLALLNDELKARLARRQSKEGNDGDEAEEPDQSTVSCVIKILLHACRSSSPLSKKIMASKSNRASSTSNDDIISIVLALVQSGTLHDVELFFAVEFLVVLIRRQVLSKQQVWTCAKALYPIFTSTQDVGLLSLSCTYYADVLEGANMDVSALSRDEQVLGLATSHQPVWELVLHGVMSKACSDAILTLFQHQAFAELSSQDRGDKLQMVACYNVRAQGLVDAAVVLLLRVASKAMNQAITSDGPQAENHALHGFIELFEAPSTWHLLRRFLENCGDNLMSPWGLFCFLKLMRMVREMPSSEETIEMQLNEQLVPQLVHLLEPKHIEWLSHWPEVVGGGSNAVKALIHAIVKVLGIPFMHNLSDELLVSTQTTLYDSSCVGKLLIVLHFVFTVKDFRLDASVLELPISFLSRLVTSSEHFGHQFVQANGMATIKACGMLNSRSSPPLVIDTLLIISQLARTSPDNYECILESGLLPEFRELVNHKEAMVRAKALNCIGNLCRHSTLFYDRFSEPISDIHGSFSVLDGVVSGLSDSDGYVRRFACFAIGNAAFHNNQLYTALRLSILPLVQNLHDEDEKTRSNAAGALGNLVRNSDELCNEMCRFHAPLELLELALTDPSVSSRRIVLFSLGNFCSYPICVESILHEEPTFLGQLERLYEEVATDEVSKKNIRRIMTKVDGITGSTPGNRFRDKYTD